MINIETINKAVALTRQGKFKEAEDIYLSLLESEAKNPILLSFIGLFYVNIKNFDKAGKYLKDAYDINKTEGTVSALGFCEFERGNYKTASDYLIEALEYGNTPEIYDKLILSLFHINKYPEAIEYSKKMYELYPDNPNAVANMVKANTQSGKLMEAEKICVEYLKEHYETPSLWFHLGFLKELIYANDKQACECYKIAESLGRQEAAYNIAVSYQKQGKYKQAEEYYNKMLESFPDDKETLTSLGMCQLAQKKFQEGYKNFFNRETAACGSTNNPWKIGQSLENNVVVLCDQGFGDHIQFIRYLPFLQKKVEKVYVVAYKSLTELFKNNYPQVEFITKDEIDPNMQAVRITDLAYILNMDFEHIPFSEGYLDCKEKSIPSEKMKVGL